MVEPIGLVDAYSMMVACLVVEPHDGDIDVISLACYEDPLVPFAPSSIHLIYPCTSPIYPCASFFHICKPFLDPTNPFLNLTLSLLH